ncbi:MAG: hypothetical protein ACUVUF_04640 [Candidatus Bathycorpusculaceae bacterium]
MVAKNKKSHRKINFMDMTDSEKIKAIRELKQNLRQKIFEAKLWQSFLNMENVVINGETIQWKNIDLKGFTIDEI